MSVGSGVFDFTETIQICEKENNEMNNKNGTNRYKED